MWLSLVFSLSLWTRVNIFLLLMMTTIAFTYLFSLEIDMILLVLTKVFYTAVLMFFFKVENIILLLLIVFCLENIIQYFAIRRIYFILIRLNLQLSWVIGIALIYFVSVHNFCLFQLVIRFPLSLIFFIKLNLILSRALIILFMFFFPVNWRQQIRNLSISSRRILFMYLLCML